MKRRPRYGHLEVMFGLLRSMMGMEGRKAKTGFGSTAAPREHRLLCRGPWVGRAQ